MFVLVFMKVIIICFVPYVYESLFFHNLTVLICVSLSLYLFIHINPLRRIHYMHFRCNVSTWNGAFVRHVLLSFLYFLTGLHHTLLNLICIYIDWHSQIHQCSLSYFSPAHELKEIKLIPLVAPFDLCLVLAPPIMYVSKENDFELEKVSWSGLFCNILEKFSLSLNKRIYFGLDLCVFNMQRTSLLIKQDMLSCFSIFQLML